MSSPGLVNLLLVVGAFGLAGWLIRSGHSLDLGGPARNWLLARAARRIAARGRYPDTIERAYWQPGEYAQDLERLEALGYTVTEESENEAFVGIEIPGPRTGVPGRIIRRRVPMFHVTYARAGVTPESAAEARPAPTSPS